MEDGKKRKKRPSDKKIILFWVGIHFIQECISTWNSVNEIEKKISILLLGKMKFGEKKSCTFVIIYIALWLVVVWSWLIIMKKNNNEIMLGKVGRYI